MLMMDLKDRKEKKHKHKLAEPENSLETFIVKSNTALHNIAQHESMDKKIHARGEKENSHKKKVIDCEIIELATAEKSDSNTNFNKVDKQKRKHRKNNDDNVSDCKFSEIDVENNTSIEIPMELNQQRKKNNFQSLDGMGHVSDYRSEESDKAINNKILDELYKRKKRHKQTEFDNKSECLKTDLNYVELSQNNLSPENFSGVHKQKRKKTLKLVTAENLLKTADMELNHISNRTINYEGIEKGSNENSDSQSNQLSRKYNKHSETKAKNREERKCKSVDDSNELDGKIVESATIEKSINAVNPNKFLKKKGKHKVAGDENVSEDRIAESVTQESENDKNIKFLKDLKKQKKNKLEHKLLGEMEYAFNHQESATHESKKNRILDALEVQEIADKYKQSEVDRILDCKTANSNVIKITQNDLNSETVYRFHEKKKKHKHELINEREGISDFDTVDSNSINLNQNYLNSKNINIFQKKKKHKHKRLDEMENLNDYKTADSESVKINQNDLNSDTVSKFHEKKKKHKSKILDERGDISNCDTMDSNSIKLNHNDLNSENINMFQKKKKKKHKVEDEMENLNDCEIAGSNFVEINQNDLNSEIVGKFHKKKKKKDKYKSLDKIENIFDCETACSNAIEINQDDISNFNKKKRKKHRHKLFDETKINCNDDNRGSAIDEAEKNMFLDTLHVLESDKCKSSNIDKISNHKTTDSTTIKINQNDFSDEIYELPKVKRKQHKQNLFEEENVPKIVTESNASNDIIYPELAKENRKKSLMQCVDAPPKTKRKNKEYVKNRNEMSNNLQKKVKSVSYIEPEKSYQQDAYLSFDPFIHNVMDVPVTFPVPLLHAGETVASVAPERKEYLEKNGIIIHNGKWTKIEDDILTRNFQQFGLEFGVNNPFQLLGINQSKRDEQLEKFKKAKHFLLHLGKDLDNRSIRSIYMRARKLLTPLKNENKFNVVETADLKHAHELVGNKWTAISDMLSRTDNTCNIAFRWHKSDIKKGKWTPEEEKSLIEAIKIVTGAEDISADNLKSVPWKSVAKYVPTRNEYQCHKHWAEHLAWDTTVSEKKQWARYHYGKLIYLLKKKYCFNSESEIDWRELHKHFKDVAPSYIFLHKKFFYLKGKLPKRIDLSYSKCLDAFKRMYEMEYKRCASEKL